MSKTFRSWDVDQRWLLPPSVHEFVPVGHPAHFVRDTVREVLDLSAIMGTYDVDRGQPPYHPGMMVALLLYGYSRGVYSSRRLALACEERVDFMAVTGLNRPDFRTISDFRLRHLTAARRTRRSATSPTPTAASSRPATASSPATTARSPSTRLIRSSSPSGWRPTPPTTPP